MPLPEFFLPELSAVYGKYLSDDNSLSKVDRKKGRVNIKQTLQICALQAVMLRVETTQDK
jgi:hypothetical protein